MRTHLVWALVLSAVAGVFVVGLVVVGIVGLAAGWFMHAAAPPRPLQRPLITLPRKAEPPPKFWGPEDLDQVLVPDE